MFDTSHIHPMLVHFPIALTLLGVLFEGLYLFRPSQFRYPCGELILYFATISALSAAVSSSLFTLDFTNPELAQIKNIYSTFAGITVILLCITSAIYLTITFIGCYIPRFSYYNLQMHKTGFVFYVLSALMVSVTGCYSGILVYNDHRYLSWFSINGLFFP